MNDTSDEVPTAFVVGDPHFKDNNITETREMARQIIDLVKNKKPTFVVVLGDTLHYNNISRIDPHNEAYYFIKSLASLAPVYLLIGNHDYSNKEQFLTDKHFFNSYKEWKSVCVVDKPFFVTYNDFSFVMCPYVPPGRFREALDGMFKEEGSDWQLADCIFAHQDFKGYLKGSFPSEEGDEWNTDFPPVISGHIHESQVVQGNVFYVGTPIQHTYAENPNKSVWFVSFGEEEAPYFKVEKLKLDIKGKKTIHLGLEDAESFDPGEAEKWHIKMVLKCSSAEFRSFRTSKQYRKLKKAGIKIKYEIQSLSQEEIGALKSREEVSYAQVLKEIVRNKNLAVQKEYTELLGDSLEPVGSVKFISED